MFFNRSQLLHSIDSSAMAISVQPSSKRGDVFATGCYSDGVLRIFDIRRSTTGILLLVTLITFIIFL